MNTNRLLRFAAFAALATAFAAPATASASDLRNIGIRTSAYGVFDVSGGSTAAGAKVIQYSVTGGANQRWDVIGAHIINTKSQLCLTTPGTVDGQLYVTFCNNANPRQDWEFQATPQTLAGGGPIRNPYTGLYVDLQGGSSLAGTPIIGYAATPTKLFDNQFFSYWFWS